MAGRRSATPSPAPLPKRLATAFAHVAADLVNPWDESTDVFRGFTAPFDAGAADSLRRSLKVAARFELDASALDLHAFDEWGEPYLSAYKVLCELMQATLADVQVVYARAPGAVRVRTWVVGIFDDAWLVGLRTETTET